MGTRAHRAMLAQLLLAASLLLDSASARAQAFVGCFKDTSAFDLDGHLERSAQNTPQACIATCAARGFAFAGVQYGESCLCGNSYGKYGPATNCDYRCTGDGNQVCGGYNANSVFTTSSAILTLPPLGPQPPQPPNPPQPPTPPPPMADCAPGLGLECDTNRSGSDYAVFDQAQADPLQCSARCTSDNSCRAWTYVRPGVQGPTARCYLKNPAPPATPNPCCVSGVAPRIIDQQVAMENDTDRHGSDYERIDLPVANPDQCFERCRGDNRCAAWTFVRPGVQGPNAVCYLKNPAPPPTPDTCCVSGAIAGGGVPVAPPQPPQPPPPPTQCDWATSNTFVQQDEGGPAQNWRGVYTRIAGNNFAASFRHPNGATKDITLTMDIVGPGRIDIQRSDYPLLNLTIGSDGVARGNYQGGTKFEVQCGGS